MKTVSAPALRVSIVAVTGEIYRGEARFVVLPSRCGELGIKPHHAPILTMLRPGNVRLHQLSGQILLVYTTGGLAEVRPDEVSILADVAFRTEASEHQAAQQAIAVAERAMREGLPIDDIAQAHARLQAELHLLALQAPRRRTRTGN